MEYYNRELNFYEELMANNRAMQEKLNKIIEIIEQATEQLESEAAANAR